MPHSPKSFRPRAPKGVLIYLLGAYVLVQFVWWAYMLVNLNAEIYGLKLELLNATHLVGPEQLILKAELDRKLSLRIWMVLGEGAVFVFILLLGFWAVRRSIAKELMLADQQKNFLLSITHELRSPLAAIRLQLQTLRTRELPEEKKTMLYDRALGETDRLQKLVENLLLANKAELGVLSIAKQWSNVSHLLMEQLQSAYSKEMEEGRLQVVATPDVNASVDSLAFQSIIVNLIDNAIKYGEGSTIKVELTAKDDMVELSVSDGGQGIPDSEKEKVFERFYRRGNEEVRQTKGTGIGLYLVRLLVDNHGGTISIHDRQPSGTTFSIQLPIAST